MIYKAHISPTRYIEFKSLEDLLLFTANFGTYDQFRQVCMDAEQPHRARDFSKLARKGNHKRLKRVLTHTLTSDGMTIAEALIERNADVQSNLQQDGTEEENPQGQEEAETEEA